MARQPSGTMLAMAGNRSALECDGRIVAAAENGSPACKVETYQGSNRIGRREMYMDISAEPVGGVEPQAFAWQEALGPTPLADPFARTADILENCPSLFLSGPLGHGAEDERMWVATRFETIREILQNNDHYSSAGLYPFFRLLGEDLRAIPLQLDPPEHTLYRKFLEPWFAPKAIIAVEDRIRAIVTKLIDNFAQKGACDAAYDFSRVYPVKIFMSLMGFPEEKFEDFLSWSHPMHFEFDNPDRMIWGARQALDYVREFVADVRRRAPDDTIASRIVHGKVDGRSLDDREVIGMVFFLWDGGMDTVAATSSLIFHRLALNPELQAELRANTHRMPLAIEEFIRMNPTVNTARMAKVDHELDGQSIKAGDRLLCLIASGNYDPEKYQDPWTFRMDRSQNRHLTFVAGSHRCLGINLARYELRIAFEEFLQRIPTFRLKQGSESLAIPGLQGAQSVPIVWNT